MSTTKLTQESVAHHDEQILVVKRANLFPDGAWQGLKKIDSEYYVSLITRHQEFMPRSLMETDPAYKQIIPYMVFEYAGRYFLMQRQSHASEQRLQNKFTLGIGGHVRQEDLLAGTTIFDWAQREFQEEVSYKGKIVFDVLGFLNDDSNPVGQVHIGLVLLLHGDSDQISVRSELKSGKLVDLQECRAHENNLESWSQMVMQELLALQR